MVKLLRQNWDKLDNVWKDVSLDDAQDSLHNVDKAKAKFEAAKKTLQADGVQFPNSF